MSKPIDLFIYRRNIRFHTDERFSAVAQSSHSVCPSIRAHLKRLIHKKDKNKSQAITAVPKRQSHPCSSALSCHFTPKSDGESIQTKNRLETANEVHEIPGSAQLLCDFGNRIRKNVPKINQTTTFRAVGMWLERMCQPLEFKVH